MKMRFAVVSCVTVLMITYFNIGPIRNRSDHGDFPERHQKQTDAASNINPAANQATTVQNIGNGQVANVLSEASGVLPKVRSLRLKRSLKPIVGQKISPALISRYQELAYAGNADAAIALAEISGTLALEEANDINSISLGKDRLHWLQIAAERGDPEAKWRYANEIAMLTRNGGSEKWRRLSTESSYKYIEVAKRYLNELLALGFVEAFHLSSTIYYLGDLDIRRNPIRAHSCLLLGLASSPADSSLRERFNWSLRQLRPGDVISAETNATCAFA